MGDAYFIITNILGTIAFALTVYSFQREGSRQIFAIQIISSLIWIIHFLMLGALSGAFMNFVNMTRSTVLVYLEERFLKFFVAIYLPVMLIFFYFFVYESLTDCLPFLNGLMGCYIMFVRDNRYIVARACLIGSLLWLAYAIIEASFPAIGTNIVIVYLSF